MSIIYGLHGMGRVVKAIKLICLSGNIIIVKVVPTTAVLKYLIVILCLQGSAGSCHLNRAVIWACLRWQWSYSHPVGSGTLLKWECWCIIR